VGWLQIDTYETIYQDVETVEGSVIFEKWFRVDARPFRQALLNIVKKWSLMFKQHLIDHVTNRQVQIALQNSLRCCYHMQTV